MAEAHSRNGVDSTNTEPGSYYQQPEFRRAMDELRSNNGRGDDGLTDWERAALGVTDLANAASNTDQPDTIEGEETSLRAMGDHGEQWLEVREHVTRNPDGTYTLDDGTVMTWDGYVYTDATTQPAGSTHEQSGDDEPDQPDDSTTGEPQGAGDTTGDGAVQATEDPEKLRREWIDYLRPYIQAVQAAIGEDIENYKEQHGGSRDRWSSRRALKQALVRVGVFSSRDDADAFPIELLEEYYKEAKRVERREAKRREREARRSGQPDVATQQSPDSDTDPDGPLLDPGDPPTPPAPLIPPAPGSAYTGPAPGQQQGPPSTQTPIPPPPGAPYPGPAPGAPQQQTRSGGTPPDPNRRQTDRRAEVLNILLDQLDGARTEWAKQSARRDRRPLFGILVARSRKYKLAKEHYRLLRNRAIQLEHETELANTTDPAQRNALAIGYLIDEDVKVREEATQFVEDRRWWKVVNGVSKAINKGPKAWRIAKRLTIGVVAGAGVSLATAGMGAPVAVGALLAVRFGNSQITKTTGGIGKLKDKQKEQLQSGRIYRSVSVGEMLARHAATVDEMYRDDGRKMTRRRLGAYALSVGTAAGGFLVGHYGEEAYHYAADNWFGGGVDHLTTGTGSEVHPDAPDPASGADGGAAGDLGSPETTATPGHDLLNTTAAYHVDQGEGWYETFQDMGIPHDKWADILNDVGPRLEDLGVAEQNGPSGEWYISHSGNLSPQALQTIADSSAKFGYVFNRIA